MRRARCQTRFRKKGRPFLRRLAQFAEALQRDLFIRAVAGGADVFVHPDDAAHAARLGLRFHVSPYVKRGVLVACGWR